MPKKRFLSVILLSVAMSLFSLDLRAADYPAPAQRVKADLVQVDKSKRRMYLLDEGRIIREFRIALGKSPKGHKQQEGDQRTPEGRYYLDYVSEQSSFYRSMNISYPNQQDIMRAELMGVSPGGAIKIHGLKDDYRGRPEYIQSFDWTNGCIALTNREMDEFLSLVDSGTPIDIEW